MSTRFSQLNHALITPIMKSKGFRKIGRYKYGALFDIATYRSNEKECRVIFSAHPYDYPDLGICFTQCSENKVVFEKEYLLKDGDLKNLLTHLAHDLESGVIDLSQ